MTSLAAADTPVTPAPSKARKRLLLTVGALLALALLAWYGSHWWLTGRFVQSTDDAYIGADTTVVGPKVSGYIAQVAVTDNQRVKAGDLLVKIDDRDYRAALAKAQGAVAAQQALLANLDATERLQQAVIDQANAGITVAAAEQVRSRNDNLRYQTLSKTSAVSLQDAQQVDATFKTAQANSARAQAQLLAAQRQVQVIDTQKQQARAALQQADADLDMARLNLGYTELRAPVDGVVGNRRARVGAYAAAGTQLLAVVPANGLWVDANFKEDQLAAMQAGQRVEVRADILPGKVFHGHLDSLAPATGAQFSVLPPENATGNFTKIVQRVPVRILLDPVDGQLGQLRPGLSVTAEVDTREGVDVHQGQASAQ